MKKEVQAPRAFDTQNWYPDSGASHHVTADPENLTQQNAFTGSEQFHMGNGRGLSITSIGSYKFVSPDHPTCYSFTQ